MFCVVWHKIISVELLYGLYIIESISCLVKYIIIFAWYIYLYKRKQDHKYEEKLKSHKRKKKGQSSDFLKRMSISLELFYALRLSKCGHSTFVFTSFVYFFRIFAHSFMISRNPIE